MLLKEAVMRLRERCMNLLQRLFRLNTLYWALFEY